MVEVVVVGATAFGRRTAVRAFTSVPGPDAWCVLPLQAVTPASRARPATARRIDRTGRTVSTRGQRTTDRPGSATEAAQHVQEQFGGTGEVGALVRRAEQAWVDEPHL